MNPEVKKLWLDALRSGEYKQGQDALQDDNGNFCCLGVLCELHRKNTQAGIEWNRSPYPNLEPGLYYYDKKDVVPYEVMVWAGLSEENPGIDSDFVEIWIDRTDGLVDYSHAASLAEANDDGFTFEDIANMIEEIL